MNRARLQIISEELRTTNAFSVDVKVLPPTLGCVEETNQMAKSIMEVGHHTYPEILRVHDKHKPASSYRHNLRNR